MAAKLRTKSTLSGRFVGFERGRLLGCELIEIVHLADGRLMLLDEEGKLRRPRQPINLRATQLLHEAGGLPFDVVLGDVVIVEPDELM